ncbi:MAG TPA: SUF system NifU family Fe-S cluster assembly protein [Candidatus Onthovivens sp.]|nr:SUF system NifU family Fe-S cluster assembly protein [Candidatus Onthovivens sp.]
MPILTNEMMREIILDHNSNPLNKKVPLDASGYYTIRMDSDSCIDDITLYLKLEKGTLKDLKFDGVACAISTASTDILCDLVINKTIKEAFYIIENYLNMLYEKDYDEEILEEANVFANTHKQASRIKCATIGFVGLQQLLEEHKNEEK